MKCRRFLFIPLTINVSFYFGNSECVYKGIPYQHNMKNHRCNIYLHPARYLPYSEYVSVICQKQRQNCRVTAANGSPFSVGIHFHVFLYGDFIRQTSTIQPTHSTFVFCFYAYRANFPDALLARVFACKEPSKQKAIQAKTRQNQALKKKCKMIIQFRRTLAKIRYNFMI